MPTLPALTPLQSLDQQNEDALNDALNQYEAAQANGIPGMSSKVAAAQNALSNYGGPALPSLGTSSTSTPTTTAAPSSGSILDQAKSAANMLLHPVDTAETAASTLLFSSRFIVLIVGVLLIGAGLFSFKQTQTVITAAGGTIKKGAALAAE